MPKSISIKLQSNFIEIALQHGCSPVNLLYIFRIRFPKNTSEGLLNCFASNPFIPANKYMLKVSNRKTRKRCEICSKLSLKTLDC